jgi:hypothetical protein
MACLAHLGEVQDRLGDLRAAGGELVVISQGRPDVVAAQLRHSPRPFPLLSDPDRAVYTRFGLERGGWRMFFKLRPLGHYLGLMFRGWRPRLPVGGEDVRQLGGDFVLDRRRRLVFAHRSADPADRPTAEVIAAQVRATAARPE